MLVPRGDDEIAGVLLGLCHQPIGDLLRLAQQADRVRGDLLAPRLRVWSELAAEAVELCPEVCALTVGDLDVVRDGVEEVLDLGLVVSAPALGERGSSEGPG